MFQSERNYSSAVTNPIYDSSIFELNVLSDADSSHIFTLTALKNVSFTMNYMINEGSSGSTKFLLNDTTLVSVPYGNHIESSLDINMSSGDVLKVEDTLYYYHTVAIVGIM